jgi:hypothetical protein
MGLQGVWRKKMKMKMNKRWRQASPRLRPLAHIPAFCRNWIRFRSWSFSHVPSLPLPVASLILNAAQERCLCIEIGSATCLCSCILGENTKKSKRQYWIHPMLAVRYLE